MPITKQEIFERIFVARWDAERGQLSNALVSLDDVAEAIREVNASRPNERPMSDRNPANFFKDFIRDKARSNRRWPQSIRAEGFTARQVTGGGACFEFVPFEPGQADPFPINIVPPPAPAAERHNIESVSLPLASRRLGRGDEAWLIQVLVRLHVIETHLSLYSTRNIVQVDHLQMSVKLRRVEIDSLFLAVEETDNQPEEIIVTCEAKGLRDDILEDQVLRQVLAVFSLPEITQNIVIPMAVKALGASLVRVVEFEAISREQALANAEAPIAITMVSDAIYEFVPPVPGIGE